MIIILKGRETQESTMCQLFMHMNIKLVFTVAIWEMYKLQFIYEESEHMSLTHFRVNSPSNQWTVLREGIVEDIREQNQSRETQSKPPDRSGSGKHYS